ncbi:purine permease [Geodermatophilus sp. YIM 151500]|uniref:nucleobase:cation symporter-2 family protein n=1 Tax=Geodermatophilus sp. YIM 151500 TaxID=2984531 RepID=UPI0021E41205|nr:nucleobase:cation symporter-2 family protein [Geodermatophilus sp. YIM 151500]MCV2487751.1 purine permease [Geodermatophilus sp. YIM 151500]
MFRRKSAGSDAAHPVDEVLPLPRMTLFGLQHVLSMYAGVIAVPLILGTALELPVADVTFLISAGLLISGVATLLQSIGVWKIGARLPIVQGTSFAAVATMLAIGTTEGGETGLRTVFGAVIVAGAAAFLLAPVFTKLLRFFPPVVTGTVITVIGVSLLPVAVRWASGGAGAEDFGEPGNIGLAGLTLLIIVLIYRFLPGFFSRVAILLGLVLGTLVAIPLGKTDLGRITEAQGFQLTEPFHFGLPIFAVGAIVSMFVVMLVIMTETTADILAIGEIVGRPADRATVTGGLRADMLSTSVAGVFNGLPVSAFAQNVGLVAITGIRSRFVVAVGGVILIVLGLFPVLGAFAAVVPLPVLGGAGLALFGTVAASGVRTLGKVDYDGNANIVIVAIALGLGVVPIAVPEFYEGFPTWFQVVFESGISAAAIAAVLLNALFNIVGRKETTEGPVFAEAPAPGTTYDTRDNEPPAVGRSRTSTEGSPAAEAPSGPPTPDRAAPPRRPTTH